MRADGKTEAAVRDALEAWADSYGKRDLEGFLAAFVADVDVTLIGTGADEVRVGRAEIQAQVTRDWAQTESIALRINSLAVSAADNVAWATADCTFEARAGGEDMKLPGRATFVLEQRDNAWRIVQSHFSSPIADQEEGHSLPGH